MLGLPIRMTMQPITAIFKHAVWNLCHLWLGRSIRVGLMKEDKLIEYNEEEDYHHYESGYYWEDLDKCSVVFVTEKMVVKYNLDHESTEEWSKYAHESADYQEKDANFFFEMKSRYTQILYLFDVSGYSHVIDGARSSDTPHGSVKSHEFVAWFNSIPFELLSEGKDDVFVERWCE